MLPSDDTDAALIVVPQTLHEASALANVIATQTIFATYQERAAAQTRRRHRAGLRCWRTYLEEAHLGDFLRPLVLDAQHHWHDPFYDDPTAWVGIGHGLLLGFIRWMQDQGYAIGTINDRLSVVKTYCRLAHLAGVIDHTAWTGIQATRWLRHAEGRHVDADRPQTRRTNAKKAAPVMLNAAQARLLKRGQPDTPQGHRDAVLFCLLLDHGLRCGEAALLQVEHIDFARWELRFERPKVSMTQTHKLTADTIRALTAYRQDMPPKGYLLLGSRKSGLLLGRMSERAITKRVADFGERHGLVGLSAHDLRHYWATAAARGKTPLKALKQAGGWNSLAMPERYIADTAIANEDVVLADE